MKRRKWVSAFLILTLFITLLSCPTLFAQELFGSGDSGTDLEEDFTAGLSDPVAGADTEFESDAFVEPAFSSDVSALSGSDPAWTGEEEQAQDSYEDSAYVVNPMWADVVTEEDLQAMFAALPEEGAADPVGGEDTVSFENPRECVDYIRSALVAHKAYVSCSVRCETKFESSMGDLFSFLLTSSFEHTGNPKEGDSLSGDLIGGWEYKVMETDVSNGYNYRLVVRFLWATNIEQQRRLDDAVAKVIALMNETGASSDYEKVSFLYHYVTEHVEYDDYNLDKKMEWIHYTAYSALVNGRAVSNGFALLVYRLMLEAGIDCRCIRGNHNEGSDDREAWNIVRLGDVYYNVDAAWDDSAYPYYGYFLRCDKNFYLHSRDIEYLTEDYYERYPMSPTDYEMPDVAIVENDGLIYETGFGEARVTGYEKSRSPVLLTIPSAVNGYTVTEISGDAFCGCDTLQEITLPAALKVIEDGTSDEGGSYTGAFANCPNLKAIHFAGDGSLLKRIGSYAFYNCTGLEEVLLPEGLERIAYLSFAGCSAIKKVVIPASVMIVGYGAFYDMSGDVFIYGADSAAGYSRERPFGEKETVIHGYGGSATQRFAEEAGYEFRMLEEEHTHEWGSPIVYREASCRNTGILHYICRTCGMDREKEIPETDHTFSDWVTIKEPTCSKTGYENRYCVLCTEIDSREVKKTKHTYGAWKTIRKATVLRTGKRSKTCSECGYIWTKTDPKLTPTWKLSAEKVTLKKGRVKTSRIITGFASGDYVKSWKSSRPSVVTVEGTKKGKVTLTAKKKGTANITAVLASGIKVSFAVTVK